MSTARQLGEIAINWAHIRATRRARSESVKTVVTLDMQRFTGIPAYQDWSHCPALARKWASVLSIEQASLVCSLDVACQVSSTAK